MVKYARRQEATFRSQQSKHVKFQKLFNAVESCFTILGDSFHPFVYIGNNKCDL